ncbi:MAG: restriction endonuclease subunit S [Ruminococcaceae bacterium]|nr:restriction endonuclease subunit S [Oscillospiraceae bacterium]
MAKLKDVCIINPKSLGFDDNLEVSFVPMSKVGENGEFDPSDVKEYHEVKKGFTYFQDGDVLFAKITPCMENGKGAIACELKNGIGFGSTEFHVLRPLTEHVSSKWLFYLLSWPSFRKEAEKNMTGSAGQKRVPKSFLEGYSVTVPTLKEQQNITDALDKVCDLISIQKQQLTKLDELVKARFVELFGDAEHNEKGLPTSPMTELCEIIDGDRGKNYPKQEEFSEEGFCLFLNAKNVTSNGFSFENCMYITEEKDKILRNGKLSRGDVVLTTRGTLGNLAFYDESVPYEHMRINSGMVILRMKRDRITERFFIEQFKMQLASIKERIASGSAQPQLPISTMNKIVMLVPDVELQNQFAAFVEQTDKSKLAIQQSLNKLETLEKSLIQKYFG